MKENLQRLAIQVSFDQAPEKDASFIGFLFLCNGLLLQKQYVKDNLLEFNLEASPAASDQRNIDPKQLRLFIAPANDNKIENVTSIEGLESYKPYEPILQINADGNFSILPVPAVISQFWPFCNCRVTGKVSKWFHVGNTWIDRSVCRARVHICEIDAIRYWIYHIPDYIIAKIPKLILDPKEIIKQPIPIPDPPPFFRNETNIVANQQAQNIFKTDSLEEKQMVAAASLPELSMDIRQNLASGNLNLIRETIVANYAILHPWFCYWPIYWPYFYRCRELAVVYTDANGRFDTNVSYWCFGDKPDIYVWVEYMINGAWTTVYNPPIPCNTLWDYACGTNINIHVTDQRIPGDCCCNCELPGELIWIRTIGNAGVTRIKQEHLLLAPAGQALTFDRIGLTDYLSAAADYKRPFGSTLSLYMGFGSDLPNAGIYYYRWRYQQIGRADLTSITGSIEYLQDIEMKDYSYEIDLGSGNIQAGHDSVKLGPQDPIGGTPYLYIIPPVLPSDAPFNKTEQNPEWYQRTHNTRTISFDSATLKNGSMNGGDGLYEFTLELFGQAGNLLTGISRNNFKVSDDTDENISVNAPDKFLENPSASTADAFKMRVRIDNSKCQCDIFPVNVNGHPGNIDCCGFVNYKPEGVEAGLDLSFLATHPNNFGELNFNVVKGTCGDVDGTQAIGMVIDSAGGYTLSGGIYKKAFTPAALLGSCYENGTGRAAFAETLYVSAMATDGVYRVYANDATPYPKITAFALEP